MGVGQPIRLTNYSSGVCVYVYLCVCMYVCCVVNTHCFSSLVLLCDVLQFSGQSAHTMKTKSKLSLIEKNPMHKSQMYTCTTQSCVVVGQSHSEFVIIMKGSEHTSFHTRGTLVHVPYERCYPFIHATLTS